VSCEIIVDRATGPIKVVNFNVEWREKMSIEVTRQHAEKVLELVNCGLVAGLGNNKPGEMCVEAAVCYAFGLPHGDNPVCVAPVLRSFKIRLNDAKWSSNQVRANGMRRLALIQLGSAGFFDNVKFAKSVASLAIKKAVPFALRAAASICKNIDHKAALLEAANLCEIEGTRQAALQAKNTADAADAHAAAHTAAATHAAHAADAAHAAAHAADAHAAAHAATHAARAAHAADAHAAAHAADAHAARDKFLSEFAEDTVQILIEMNVPGVQWLDLAPLN